MHLPNHKPLDHFLVVLLCHAVNDPFSSDPCLAYRHGSFLNDPFSSDPCLAYRHGSFLNDPFSSDPCLAYCRGSFSNDPFLHDHRHHVPYLPWSKVSVDVVQAYECHVS